MMIKNKYFCIIFMWKINTINWNIKHEIRRKIRHAVLGSHPDTTRFLVVSSPF